MIAYQALAIIFIRSSVFHTYWTPVVYSMLMIAYFHTYSPINNYINLHIFDFGDYPSVASITVFTLFTIIAPIPIIAIKIFYNALRLHQQQSSIKVIDNNFSQLSQVMTGVKAIKDISSQLRERIMSKAANKFLTSGEVTQDDLYDFIKEEIREEYESLSRRLSRL